MNASTDVVIYSAATHDAVPLNPIAICARIWRQRQLLRQLTNRAIQMRFRGSMLGFLWTILNPIFMLLVYTGVFSLILKVRWNGEGSTLFFAMNLFCGLIVYGIFSESVGGASIQIISNPSYVKKIVFPLEILPVAGLAAAVFFNLFGLVILLVCVQFFVHPLSIHIVTLPIIWLPLLFLTTGISWLVAALGVLVRDVAQLVIILLQVLFYLCPIVYPLARIPLSLQKTYLLLNPMAVYLEQTRAVVLDKSWPQWSWMPQSYLISLGVFIFGYYIFMRAKRGFADVI